MKMTSVWLDSQPLPKFPFVKTGITVDAIVVGGGITGVTAAYLLKKAGLKVALLERERCGGVDTSYTTAHLTCVTDARLHKLESTFGKDRARAVWEAGFSAMDQMVANIEAEEVECDFRWVPGYLFAAINGQEANIQSLRKDAALAREFGFSAEFVEA